MSVTKETELLGIFTRTQLLGKFSMSVRAQSIANFDYESLPLAKHLTNIEIMKI